MRYFIKNSYWNNDYYGWPPDKKGLTGEGIEKLLSHLYKAPENAAKG